MTVELVSEVFARERTDVRRLAQRVPGAQGLHPGHKARRKLLGDARLHEEALGRDAALPGVLEARLDRRLRGGIDVRVREHDERIGATELEHGLLDLPPDSRATACPPARYPSSVAATMRTS